MKRPATQPRALRNLLLAGAIAAGSLAQAEPVLHEFIDLGPGRGLVEPAFSGPLPFGQATPSTDTDEPGQPGDATGGGSSNGSLGSTFSIDRDTTRPEEVTYQDPFTPTVVPFKRSTVYDTVNRDADLAVRDVTLSAVETLAQARPNDEHFHASLRLDLKAGQRIPIPSVAPGARVVVAHTDPPVALRIGVDSAENWFVEADVTREVQLTLQVVADRRVFGSEFKDASWADLARALPPLPTAIKSSARDVARTLGVGDAVRPRQAVASLVEHFRRFAPSSRRPTSHGLALYRELSLTARGICRHRSYAFMITALGLGIPTRLAMNEAHAWVEVFDGELWHRIDLGGAAEHLSMDDQGRPRHVEPRDLFPWPDPTESGQALAERRGFPAPEAAAPSAAGVNAGEPSPAGSDPAPPAAAQGPGAQPPNAPLPPDPTSPPGAASQSPQPAQLPRELPDPGATDPGTQAPVEAAPDPTPPPDAPVPLPEGSVSFGAGNASAERGKGLFVSGQVQTGQRACNGVRIDISLGNPGGASIALGTLVSDERGRFRGQVVVPWGAPLGDQQLFASASGNCALR